jgi:hypothetical protein
MTTYNLGDIVETFDGRKGKVIDNGGGIYTVRFLDGSESRYDAGCLTLVRAAA